MRLIKKLAIALGSVMAFAAVQAPTMAASHAIIDTPSIIAGVFSSLRFKTINLWRDINDLLKNLIL